MKNNELDLLLVFPSLSKSESYGKKIKSKVGYLPPLGILSLAAYARQNGFSVKIIEPVILDMELDDVIKKIKEEDPKVIGISILTPMYSKGVQYAKEIRKNFPEKIIIMGGHHVTLFKEKIFSDCPEIDMLVMGEGELTLLELMTVLKKNDYSRKINASKLEKINGIIFQKNKKPIHTHPRELITDLNILPYPARDLIPLEKYIPVPIEYKRLPVVHMMVSRGCPFNCTYCSTHAAFGYKVRFKSPENVIAEMKYLIKTYGAKQISFWDDTLTINKKWLTEVCNLIIKEKLDIIWNCYAHVNTINDELLKKMKEAGCFCIWYGIEAGDDGLLKTINKGTTTDGVRKAVKLTKDNGIEVRGLFMLALPGETPELARKTIDFAKELDLDYAQFTLTTPHVGTQLFEDAKKHGKLRLDYSEFTQLSSVFVPYAYGSEEELKKLSKTAVREFYFRPGYIFKQFIKIRSLYDIKRYWEALKIVLAFS